ncbi:DUF4145 domain-containing protein [Microvirga yunnanensis]|uniref:DUF4145 domain-containing protein n=1 Tax=Microvirga yunnanensis TaxID=2953740 RepID=UPI0021C86766|nr:DUF4145 domain-containing protein [Microvirga sp. HBU65207]
MQQLNLLDVPTVRGTRTIELWQGDICTPPEHVDALVVSAIEDDYAPTPTSVIGALLRVHSIDISELAKRPSLNLDALCTWLSFSGAEAPFGGIICVNVPADASDLREVFQNAFIALAVAERKYPEIRTIAMPILSTGDHRRDVRHVTDVLMQESVGFLERAHSVKKIIFMAQSQQKASELSNAMNLYLGREQGVSAKGQVADAVRAELQELLHRVTVLDPAGAPIYSNMSRLLLSRESQSFEIGTLGRRLAEHVCGHVVTDKKTASADLMTKINALPSLGIAHWIASYMHILRVFGNEEVHQKAKEKSPPVLSPGDLIVCLSAICRVLDFWTDYRNSADNRVQLEG